MGFTLADALNQSQEQYHLKLLAGQEGCSNAISWVHMIEDTTIIQQLWGKELVVTTGHGFQSEEELFMLIKCLIKYNSVGLIINIGKYIFEIPSAIIDYCNEQEFPLLTIPWEVHLADLIKDFCMRCLYSEKEDRELSKLFQEILTNNQIVEEARPQLMSAFDVDGNFQVVLISVEGSDNFNAIERRKIAFQIELCFEKIDSSYAFFWYDGYFVLIVNNLKADELKVIIDKMYKRAKKRIDDKRVYLGIGSQMKDLGQVYLSYKRAKAAILMAMQFELPIVFFEDMGVYQILFSIEDKQILIEMYHRLLQPLIDYDQKHHGELEKTLFYYLIYGESQITMAKNLYMHRNTINYRMNKIKELLNCQLDTFEEKVPYMLSYYIKKVLEEKK
ncbi:PucR family transcriptional regulator [Thomasclavelia spiroformis]|uniref:PucR family transcriptional regulator n=1 Tax=Thomasclavelia spiroformis TaxID=29348 RepID=UPI0026DBB3BB|nr:PucR family transcriptional regulator [Thomasclavelia spiroformis]